MLPTGLRLIISCKDEIWTVFRRFFGVPQGSNLALANLLNSNCFLQKQVEIAIFMPPKELWEAYSNRTVRPSVRPSRFRVRSISPIFFEVGIPNLVRGCILGWRSVAYHFRVTVTLTSDLVFRIIVSGAYLLYYLRKESQIWCVVASWDEEVSRTIIGSLDLELDL